METVTRLTRWTHQERAFDDTEAAIESGERKIVVTSPTGSGKTRMLIDLTEWAVARGWTVAVFTNRRLLASQIKRVLESHGIELGMIAAGYDRALTRPVQLCMTQTIGARWGRQELPNVQLIIIDECHLQKGSIIERVVEHYGAAKVVGYTATPLDLEGWTHLVVASVMSECIATGCIVPAHTFAPDEPDLRNIKRYQVGVDLSEPDNVKAIMRPGVFGRVYEHWQRLNEGRPTILFGPDVKGSLWFAEQFWNQGIPAAHVDGSDVWCNGHFIREDGARDYVLDGIRSGDIRIVCNRFVLREGIDLPELEHGILATVFGSLSSYIQSAGRLLRAFPGKSHAVIQDHGGNWHRHGSVNSDREWSLGLTNRRVVGERQEQMREKKEPEPITCPQCHQLRWSGNKCPWCGKESHGRSRMVVEVNGELREVGGEIYRPRKIREKPDTAQRWEKYYYSQRRAGRTFNQAYAWFFHEEHYWPPRNLPLMPQTSADWYAHISEVPCERLVPKQAEVRAM